VALSGAAAVAGRDHTAGRAAGLDLIRFHGQHQPAAVVLIHIDHVHAGNIEDRIGSGAQRKLGRL
jgi:hypothetical protein